MRDVEQLFIDIKTAADNHIETPRYVMNIIGYLMYVQNDILGETAAHDLA